MIRVDALRRCGPIIWEQLLATGQVLAICVGVDPVHPVLTTGQGYRERVSVCVQYRSCPVILDSTAYPAYRRVRRRRVRIMHDYCVQVKF